MRKRALEVRSDAVGEKICLGWVFESGRDNTGRRIDLHQAITRGDEKQAHDP
jgi:hypothetical protein